MNRKTKMLEAASSNGDGMRKMRATIESCLRALRRELSPTFPAPAGRLRDSSPVGSLQLGPAWGGRHAPSNPQTNHGWEEDGEYSNHFSPCGCVGVSSEACPPPMPELPGLVKLSTESFCTESFCTSQNHFVHHEHRIILYINVC